MELTVLFVFVYKQSVQGENGQDADKSRSDRLQQHPLGAVSRRGCILSGAVAIRKSDESKDVNKTSRRDESSS